MTDANRYRVFGPVNDADDDSRPAPQQPFGTAGVVEAMLFVGGRPLTPEAIAESCDGVSRDDVVGTIAELNQLYFRQGRPYEIRRLRDGYQMMLRAQFASVVRRMHRHNREVRLSAAAIEVLSLVAYRQPVSAHEVDAVRGTDSAAILRQLRRRRLIEPVEHQPGSGRAVQYKTTRRFLDLFHLTTLDDLPRVQELEKP